MNGFEVYREYIAIKLHFTNDYYDYFKVGGRTTANIHSYNKRKDQYFFDYLAKNGGDESDIKMKLVLYFLNERHMYIKEIVEEYRKRPNYFLQWLGFIEGFPYTAIKQFGEIRDGFIKAKSSTISTQNIDVFHSPIIFEKYLEKEIYAESFILFDSFFKISKLLKHNLLWKEESKILKKYFPFVQKYIQPHFNEQTKQQILSTFTLFKGETTYV
jgi:hypothetical protein